MLNPILEKMWVLNLERIRKHKIKIKIIKLQIPTEYSQFKCILYMYHLFQSYRVAGW